MSVSQTSVDGTAGTRARHPIGLYVLFFTEMWERFSFYTMSALFKLYMVDPNNGHPFLQRNSNQILGLYLAGVYFTPFFGGIFAEWKWGYRLCIVLGGILMGIGHLLLAFDPMPFFLGGLLFLVLGNGLFKPNISTMVGKLYPPGDPRMDTAFTIFYMGINVGAFAAPLAAGAVRNSYGFHPAFGMAGIGMAISLAIFLALQQWVTEAHSASRAEPGRTPIADVTAELQRGRHRALLIIFGITILFWMAFKQNANTLNLWARDRTDRTPPGWMAELFGTTGTRSWFLNDKGEFPPEWQSSINPLFVILFSPLLLWVWQSLRSRGRNVTTPAKMVLGLMLTGLAFVVMSVAGAMGGDEGVRMTPLVLLGAYAVLTLGELCVSPVGLSLVSKLAAPRQRAIWMGAFFGSTAVGGYLSGAIGVFWEKWKHSEFFGLLAGTSFFAMALMLIAYRSVARVMPPEGKMPPPAEPTPQREPTPAAS